MHWSSTNRSRPFMLSWYSHLRFDRRKVPANESVRGSSVPAILRKSAQQLGRSTIALLTKGGLSETRGPPFRVRTRVDAAASPSRGDGALRAVRRQLRLLGWRRVRLRGLFPCCKGKGGAPLQPFPSVLAVPSPTLPSSHAPRRGTCRELPHERDVPRPLFCASSARIPLPLESREKGGAALFPWCGLAVVVGCELLRGRQHCQGSQ
eukprot:gene14352-biopygen10454